MKILMYVLGGFLFVAAAYLVVVIVALQRSKRPQHCRNCNDDTLEYLGFVTEPFNAENRDNFIPRAYYRCDHCQLSAKLERGDWYDVPSEEVLQAIGDVAE